MKNSTTIISPKKKLSFHYFHEINDYRDLLFFLVKKEITVIYKQTVLGFSWAIIRPVFSMIVFSVVFGGLANVPSDGVPYPIFSYVALVPWTYFSGSITKSTNSLINSSNIFTKVYFPRILIPFSAVISGLVDFLIALAVIGVLMAYYSIIPTWNILWLPILIIIMVLFSSGIGFILSALAIQYRDVRHAIQFMSQLLMYAAPVVWPVTLITEKFGDNAKLIYGSYPMVGVIEGFRSAFLGHEKMPFDIIAIGFVVSIIFFAIGFYYFNKKEQIFVDVA